MSDMTLTQPVEFFTVRVNNYKDDPTHDKTSLHGLFTDRAEAEKIAHATNVGWDFLHADVVPLRLGTFEAIAQAQGITHIEPDLPADFTGSAAGGDMEQVPCDERHNQRIEARGSCTKCGGAEPVHADDDIVTADGFADMTYRVARRTPGHPANPHPVGSYGNPTRESIAAEVAAEAEVMEALPTEHAAASTSVVEERDPVADAVALAEVIHEADWTMAGPRWAWHQATIAQREDALLMAVAAVADPTLDDDALEALVERYWSTKPKHGAPRRVSAKASKIREWLIHHGLREQGQ